MSCINSVWIKLLSTQVGKDQFGNRYFIGNNKNYLGQAKRFVIYNGQDEGSKVPPMWHAWLHYLSDDVPTVDNNKVYNWQQEYVPNLSSTKCAYNLAQSSCTKIETYSKWSPE